MRALAAAVLLAALLLPTALTAAAAQSPLPPGESEDLTISILPDGALAVWYAAAYPIEALNQTAMLLAKTEALGATLTIITTPATSNITAELTIYGENLNPANASAIAAALRKALDIDLKPETIYNDTITYRAPVTREKLAKLIDELKPETGGGGFSPRLNRAFLEKFPQTSIVLEVVKMGWGVSTSFEVRAVGGQAPRTDNTYRLNILETLGVGELRPPRDAILNILFLPPPGSKLTSYRISPKAVNASQLAPGIDALYIQLTGDLTLRELVIELEYSPANITSIFEQLQDFMKFVEKLEISNSPQNRTATPAITGPGGTTGETTTTGPAGQGESEGGPAETTPPETGGAETPTGGMERDRASELPPIEQLSNLSRIDPLTLLALTSLAVVTIVFTTVYVRGGLRKAAGGAAVTALSILLLTSTLTPILVVKTVWAEQVGGGLESLLEVEQYIPGRAPPDLEIPLLFPSFKQIDKVSKTFISFEEIKLLTTPSLRAPYNPQGLAKLLATLGIDLRLIQSAGLLLGGGLNPLGMFKGLTLAHGGTSAFLPNEDVGANVYMVFKAKPSKTLESMLNAINTVYKIGYSLYHSTICFPGDGCLHPIGQAMMITALLAALYLAVTVPGFMVYAHASYPTDISSELKASTGYVDGPAVKDKERVWLTENRYMVSLAILIMILKAPTLSGWKGAKSLADIPLTASFHVSSDADSGWTLTALLGAYSGDRGLKVGVDFRDALGIWELFKILSTSFSSAWSGIVSVVSGSLNEVAATLYQAEIALETLAVILAGPRGEEFREAYGYIVSAASKIRNARTLLSDARIKLSNYNCEGVIQNVSGARESIQSAIQDLNSLKDKYPDIYRAVSGIVNQLERTLTSLEEFNEQAEGLCAPFNFRAEPPSDPEALPDEQKVTLTYLVFSATPLVTKAVHSKGVSTLTLRAYYGWNPMPQMVQAVAVTARSVTQTARDLAYNTLDQVGTITSAVQQLVEPDLNQGMQGLLGGLGGFVDSIEGLVGQILGPLQTMFAEIKNLLTSLKDKLISFIDRLVDQIKAVFDTLKKTVQTLINQLVSAITNMLTSFIAGIANAILGPIIKALVEPLIQSIASGLLSQYIAQIIQEMITNFIKEIIDKFIQEIIGKFIQNIFAGIDALLNNILEPINKIKEAINKWHQQIMDFIEKGMRQLLGPIHNVLSIVKGDILKLPGTGGGLNIGSSLTSAVSGFASGVLSKERKTVEEAVRKLNEMERKILGTLVRARDAATQLSSLIRIPVIGRGGQLQATLLGIGESAVSDDYGNLGTIAFPHDPQKKIAGWYDEYTLILHTAGLTMSIPADYSLVAPFIEDLRALLGAAPPSVLWVKVNEVGPVLRGDTIDIAILGDPNRPSVPGGRESSRVYVTLPDGSITQLSLDSLPTIRPIEQPPSSTTLIGPFFPFPLDGPLLSPFFPFPFPGRPPPVAFSVSVFEEPVEDPSATSVPRVLVPADTATGTVLLAPFFPFPMNKPPAA
jgi:uncharacterized membrane protein YvlD (DUF360 family)